MAKQVSASHAKGKQAKPAKRGKPEAPPQVAQPEPMDPEPEAPAVVAEYPQCGCGARLVLETEKAAQLCEACQAVRVAVPATIATRINQVAAEQIERHAQLTAAESELYALGKKPKRSLSEEDRARQEALSAITSDLDNGIADAWEALEKELGEACPISVQDVIDAVADGRWVPLPIATTSETPTTEATSEPAPETPAASEALTPPEPVQQSLLPAEPFDEHAAFEDITKQARTVEAYQKTYDEKKQAAADAKKQLDAAAALLTSKVTTYDARARAWHAQQEREAELQAAHLAKLEAEAAAKAQGELPMGATENASSAVSTNLHGNEQAAVEAPCGGLTGVQLPDTSVSECACGKALATNDEAANGQCSECAPPAPVESPAPESAWTI